MVNIKEVAKQAGVSPSTVSRVLTGNIPVASETRQKVLEAVKDLDYQPNPLAQGLKGTRIKTIGLIIPNVRNLVFPAAIRGIEDTAKKYGYTVVLCNTDESLEKEMSYIHNLRRRLINGFILSTARINSPHLLDLKEDNFPVICLIRHLGEELDAVVLDNLDGAYQAVKYLIERGHKKIAIINGDMGVQLYRERFAGYKKALEEAGIALDPDLIVENISGWNESGRVVHDMLFAGVRPDAIFGTNDPKAIGAMRAVKDFGLKVPDDISIVGFDDSDVAAFLDPPLTTVAQPFYEMGVKACERIIRMIESKRRSRPRVEVLPARLVVRGSVR